MTWTQNKAYLGAAVLILTTTFVTACVRNGSKNDTPPVTKSMDLENETLSNEQVFKNAQLSFDETLTGNVEELSKNYLFETDKIIDFQLVIGEVQTQECQTQAGFQYIFTLIDSQGRTLVLNEKSPKETLKPGAYRIHLKVFNSAFCRKIDLAFALKTQIREDMTLTGYPNIAYECRFVTENGAAKNQRYARIQSNPMRLTQFRFSGNEKIDETLLGNQICSQALPEGSQCELDTVPVLKDQGPIVATQIRCSNGKLSANAILQMNINEKSEVRTASFYCQNGEIQKAVRLQDCHIQSRFNYPLPIIAKESHFHIDRNELIVNYTLEEELKASLIPNRPVFVMIFAQGEDGTEYPLLKANHQYRYELIQNGDFKIANGEKIRQRMAEFAPENLRLVFSHEPFDLSHIETVHRGFRFIHFGEFCQANPNGMSIKTKGGPVESFCE